MRQLMTLEEVADYLQKPKSWVYGNWSKAGIPFKKVGNHLRCRQVDLENWLDGEVSRHR